MMSSRDAQNGHHALGVFVFRMLGGVGEGELGQGEVHDGRVGQGNRQGGENGRETGG